MIRTRDGLPWAEALAPEPRVVRTLPDLPARLAFATLWASGADPRRDALVRVQAVRLADGRWESLVRPCRPAARDDAAESSAAGARLAHEFGVHGAELEDAPEAPGVLRELVRFLAGCTVIVPSRAPFQAWIGAAEGAALEERADAPRALALSEIAALCLPGRLATEGENLATALLGHAPERGPRAHEPAHLRAALGVLAARVLGQEEAPLAVLVHALANAGRALEREGRALDELAFLLALLERPSAWVDPARALEPEQAELRDGRVRVALERFPTPESALDGARPRWTRARGEDPDEELPAVRCEEPRTLGADDLRCVDEIFQEHLPRQLAAGGAEAGYRAGQHAVAGVIAEGFGRRELRLVHAPTGTGKTLAYLVPCALWALRHQVRVGVATFTRVLQEQAMERETPLALALLRAGAGARGIRVAVLKGRENYLCWRALCLQARGPGDPPEEQLAWSALALFALRDEEGDLDRFSLRGALPGLDPERWRRALERLLRASRCETGCCSYASDRATCAAESAWRRAERAHVVITNHALALARRDFFQHLVFDECEHLHDVALSAFSSSVGLRELDELLGRLSGADGRRPLERVVSLAPPDSAAAVLGQACRTATASARAAVAELGRGCRAFKAWRAQQARARQAADEHSLFREYVLAQGEPVLAPHAELCAALLELGTELAQLAECLDEALPARETPRVRRALEVLRVELEELRRAVDAWIPRDERGAPAFGREAFHDLETTVAGEDVLAVRVLLPHEYLGRHYYPTLAGAVLLSATTWLRGGFEAAAAYLGLARAAEPAEDEEREPMVVHSFRAPEAFDYARVLVAVPRDVPAVHDKGAFLDYTARFLGYLAERTRGRLLALFTNAEDLSQVGGALEPFFAARHIPFWWQRMRGVGKEELGQLFRAHVDSVLLGLDTFWYGADFPGSTLEYLVIVRLPYGVPDRYHHAQCSVLGNSVQRRTIYLPRALAKFRQGFGRLMRKESDRGCVFVLDKRVLDPRHRLFLDELPLVTAWDEAARGERLARLVQGDAERCLDEAFAHMGMKADLRRRGLERGFAGWRAE